MKKYRTKWGVVIFIPLVIFTLLLIDSILNKTLAGGIISLIGMAYTGHIALSTYYIISAKTLRVKSSVFFDKTIDIMTIKKINEIVDIFGAPAASVKRLLIKYNDNDSVAISPNDKSNFIKELKEINPDIQCQVKN